nr:hypothetical protein [Tanacetum cinerariifolium]
EKDDSINLKRLLEFEKEKALYSSLFHQLDSMDASFLESDFTLAEVKAALWNSSGSKAPGLNHINFNFIKSVSSVLYMVLMVGSRQIVGMVCSTKKVLWKGITDISLVIDNMGIPFRDSFIKKVGNGENTLFWKDTWFDCGLAFMVRFHRPFAIENNKDCDISDHWEIQELSALLSGLCLHEGWMWLLDHVTSFLVKHISKLIDDANLFNNISGKTNEWNPFLPKKINIFVWRLALNRLPLLTTLADKGFDIPSILCHGVCMYILWSLCKRRNKVVHATSKTKDEELRVNIFTMAQANLLFWIANGSSKRLACLKSFASSRDG